MLKIFDKAYDSAPFLQNKLSSYHLQKKMLFSFIILAVGAVINFGYIFLIHLTISFTIAGIIVWTIQFINKSLFFDTRQWRITILAYVLCLSPSVSFTENILGTFIIFIGVGVLTLNHKHIINPTLLGILGAQALNINYSDVFATPIPYIVKNLSELYPNTPLLTHYITSNHLVANQINSITTSWAMPEASFFSLQNDMLSFILTPKVTWFGAGSILLLVLVSLNMIITKVISYIPILLYLCSYLLLTGILQFTKTGALELQTAIKDSSLWFTVVVLLSIFKPQHKKAIYFFSSITACLTALLNFRQHLSINYIFILILTNLSMPLIEFLSKDPVFGVKKPLYSFKIEYKEFHKLRIIIGVCLFGISVLSAQYFFQSPLLDRQEEVQLKLVQQFFPEDIIQISDQHSQVYCVLITPPRYAIYTKSSLYRSDVELMVEINKDIIKNIEILSLKTAHTYYNNFEWLELFIGTDINKLDCILEEKEKLITYNKDILLVRTIIQALKQTQTIYKTLRKEN